MTQRSTSVILAQLMFSNSSTEYTIKKYIYLVKTKTVWK